MKILFTVFLLYFLLYFYIKNFYRENYLEYYLIYFSTFFFIFLIYLILPIIGVVKLLKKGGVSNFFNFKFSFKETFINYIFIAQSINLIGIKSEENKFFSVSISNFEFKVILISILEEITRIFAYKAIKDHRFSFHIVSFISMMSHGFYNFEQFPHDKIGFIFFFASLYIFSFFMIQNTLQNGIFSSILIHITRNIIVFGFFPSSTELSPYIFQGFIGLCLLFVLIKKYENLPPT